MPALWAGAASGHAPAAIGVWRAMPEPRLEPAASATRLAFAVAGVVQSAWAALIPFARAHAGLGDAALGGLLLCLGAGSMAAMPIASGIASRAGGARVMVVAGAALAVLLPLLSVLGSVAALAVALALFGAALGALDVAMNLHAIAIERAAGRPMMSGFHGLYSAGGIAGAGGMAGLLALGAPAPAAAVLVGALALAAIGRAGGGFLPRTERAPAAAPPFFVRPHGVVLLVGALAFVLCLAEGAMLDWSAVFLADARHVAHAEAGAGYAAFAAAMTAGRLAGDRLVAAIGRVRAVIGGMLLAGAGFALAAALPWAAASCAAFALVGLGCANVVPVLFGAAARQDAMPPHAALAAITALGYAGILAGPALIGPVAQATGLATAFLLLAALLAVSAASALPIRPLL